jgi:peptidoglycan/LPS O-acetylase OafA/YrhL
VIVGVGADRHRGDLDGLRAVAIIVVVLFHAGVPGFSFGFIGVDVFFVISGFLITSILVRELDEQDGLRLGRFWGRRARRLLPAATVMTVAVLAASQLVESPLEWRERLADGLSTIFYWSNEHFASARTDYFAPGVESSPFLHTWSLAVEEQFYLFWPVLLLCAHRFGAGRSAARPVVVALVGTASFVVALRAAGGPQGFYLASARIWELAVGGMVAACAPLIAAWTRRIASVVGLTSIAAFGVAAALIGRSDAPSPWLLLLPVGSAAGLIIAGLPGRWPIGRFLSLPPFQTIGRLSYSWYLWHWPVIVLGMAHLGSRSDGVRLMLAVSSLLPAILTHHLVENPIRFSRVLVVSTRKTALVAAASVAVALAALGLANLRTQEVLANPAVALARSGREGFVPVAPACQSADADVLLSECSGGDPDAPTTVLLVGDSHARHWSPALDAAGRSSSFRLVESVMGGCPALGPPSSNEVPLCASRRAELRALIRQVEPDLVIVSHSLGYVTDAVTGGAPSGIETKLDAWRAAHEAFATWLESEGSALGVILDTPRFGYDPNECLAEQRAAGRCDLSVAAARASVRSVHKAEVDGLRAAGHGSYLDPLSFLCDAATCPVTSGGIPVFVDDGHLTAEYVSTITPQLREFARRVLAAPDGQANRA